jgi:large subunit ribosomal protein L14
MIQAGTYLNILDNSGARKVKCIKIFRSGPKQRYAFIGALLIVSIKTIKFSKTIKVKKGEIHKALIIKTKTKKLISGLNYKNYFENSAILINKKNKLLGTRIFGLLPRCFKYSKYLKLITLGSGISL